MWGFHGFFVTFFQQNGYQKIGLKAFKNCLWFCGEVLSPYIQLKNRSGWLGWWK